MQWVLPRAVLAAGLHAGLVFLLATCFILHAPPSFAKDLPSPVEAAKLPKRNEVKIGYLHQQVAAEPPASRLDIEPEDIGRAGAETALKENNAAGQFTGDLYTIEEELVPPDGDAKAAMQKLLDQNIRYVIVDAPAKTLLTLAEMAEGKEVLLFNIRAAETSLRQEGCRANVLHVAPDRTMLADALGQYLITENWKNWLLVTGSTEADKEYADALKRSAGRFGATIVAERQYAERPGMDRDEVGTLPAPEQGSTSAADAAPHYDVILLADEDERWAPYAPYRGGGMRPIAGSAGLMATSWHAGHAKWGARQLNNHFEEDHDRYMLPLDYHAYVAARSIGEAVTRNRKADFETIKAFIHGDKFQLNAFKGVRHTYRSWDGQFRQPILLTTDKVVVTVSPQPGFPHPSAPDLLVDTLGIDQDESKCKM